MADQNGITHPLRRFGPGRRQQPAPAARSAVIAPAAPACIGRTRPPARPAFTLTEMVISIGILLLLAGIVLTAVTRARRAASGVQCLSNLRQIHTAFTLHAQRNGGRYPHPYQAGTSWEGSLKGMLNSTDVFRCAGDQEIAPIMGSSYDWRDTPDPRTTLAGRALTDTRRTDAVLAFESLPGWHATRKMNAVRIDGAAMSMDQGECLADLSRPIR